jgi:transcriptional regulator with XRE-family HTH domain
MTTGRRALVALLQRTSGRFVAARIRVTASTVSRWASGQRTPSVAARRALFVTYGIPLHSWAERAPSPKRRTG